MQYSLVWVSHINCFIVHWRHCMPAHCLDTSSSLRSSYISNVTQTKHSWQRNAIFPFWGEIIRIFHGYHRKLFHKLFRQNYLTERKFGTYEILPIHIQSCIQTRTYIYTHVTRASRMQTRTQTYEFTHARTQAQKHGRKKARMHTQHLHTQARIHTHTHTHASKEMLTIYVKITHPMWSVSYSASQIKHSC